MITAGYNLGKAYKVLHAVKHSTYVSMCVEKMNFNYSE